MPPPWGPASSASGAQGFRRQRARDRPLPPQRFAVELFDRGSSAGERSFDAGREITNQALIHGKLAGRDKDAAMERFARGETKILVSTTVIEVGVDVPAAAVMVIEHAERFGLAQLHQLRGRIGRGSRPSTCLLLYKGPLGQTAQARLEMMRQTEDGFRIAELDLEERGMGDLIGARQSGGFELRHARLPADTDLLDRARELAGTLIAADAALQRADHQRLKERAVSRYPRAVELFRVG